MAALKLGADAVSMVDIDPQAITASQRNAERNGIDAGLWVGEPSNLTGSHYDLLVANILANPLLALAQRFAELVSPGGSLLLTGLLDAQEQSIKDAYSAWFSDWSAAHRDGWLCLHSKRSAYT